MKVAISMGRIWLGGDGSLGGGAIIRVLSVEREIERVLEVEFEQLSREAFSPELPLA